MFSTHIRLTKFGSGRWSRVLFLPHNNNVLLVNDSLSSRGIQHSVGINVISNLSNVTYKLSSIFTLIFNIPLLMIGMFNSIEIYLVGMKYQDLITLNNNNHMNIHIF